LVRDTPRNAAETFVGPYAVPPDTMVSVPTFTIQHDARYFASPDVWMPERWTTSPELVLDKRAFNTFNTGAHSCAGKMFALLEAKVFFSKVVGAFEIGFAPGEDGTDLMTKNRDHMTWHCPDLRLCLVPRSEKM
jgi:cytochrome P450 family 628